MASSLVRVRTLVVLGTFALATVGVLLPAAVAQAKPSAAEIQKQITQINDQIEVVVEQYNGVHAKLAKDKAKAKALEQQIGPAQLQATIAEQRIGAIAHNIYMNGPATALEALLSTSSTNDLISEMGALDEIARQQRASITTASALVNKYQGQKNALDALITKEKAQDAQLAAQKTKILSQLATLKKLQNQINATTGGGSGGGGSSGGGGGGGSKYSKSYVMPVSCPYTSSSGKGHTAAVKACSLVWPIHMYGWAQTGPSRYDCSGLTLTAWKAAGVSLTHFTGGQWNETTHHAYTGTGGLIPGDLIFYYSDHHHVAIYIGGGWIVQAEQTGEPLKESKIGFVKPSGWSRP